ncbi:hypothetical protein, conserved [Plasmodium gonderi]|uniref:Uncharacterized protein n=1 Tax=Plasmodium gonderi TaxID=77519 RepID=A0A1Y1JJT6_PLAGO|nr:hypothetical protein, conserved [Plasmodium gonderi]GAW80314.1 hypothetical protein, conserved [Plasmodium gonderi]
MEERKPVCSSLAIGLLFYLCYFFYFGSYIFQMYFLVFSKVDYILFGVLLIMTIVSISLASSGLMQSSIFVVVIILLVEIYEYKNYVYPNIIDSEFNKMFLIFRLFVTINFLLFFYLHIKNLKKKKKIELYKSKSEEKKTQKSQENNLSPNINGLSKYNTVPVRGNITQEVIAHFPCQHNNGVPEKKTEIIEGHTLKILSIPIIQKEERPQPSEIFSQPCKVFELQSQNNPYMHYSLKTVENNTQPFAVNQTINSNTSASDNLNMSYNRQYTYPWVPNNSNANNNSNNSNANNNSNNSNNNNDNNNLCGNDVITSGGENQHLNGRVYGNNTSIPFYNGTLNLPNPNYFPNNRNLYQTMPNKTDPYQAGTYQSGGYQTGV